MISQRQFAREFFRALYYALYPVVSAGWFQTASLALQKIIPLRLNNPMLYAKLIYSMLHFVLVFSIVWFYFKERKYIKYTAYIMAAWFGANVGMNLIGKVLHIEAMLRSARTSQDMFLSPFIVAFLLPTFQLQRNIDKQKQSEEAGSNPAEEEKT
jgi:uncharacterized membrane protein